MGDIPTSYDARKTRIEPDTHWSGTPPRYRDVEAFWLDLTEVTREAYAACVAKGDCTAAQCDSGTPDPVAQYDAEQVGSVPQTCVTHAQAETYCTAHGARLPTEAEWEYAARGVDARIYPWGNEVRDEFRNQLVPINGLVDISYFGFRGMATSGREWVADTFEIDVGLRAFVNEPFRAPQGPLSRAIAKHGTAHVTKGGRTGARAPGLGADPMVSFRCAASIEGDEETLSVPAAAPPLPLLASQNGLQFFGGVAEVLDRAEAETFCRVLSVPEGAEKLEGWRLPSFEEITANADVFRGPGPFWTQEGAASQHTMDPTGVVPADAPWAEVSAKPSEGLAVRCVRG